MKMSKIEISLKKKEGLEKWYLKAKTEFEESLNKNPLDQILALKKFDDKSRQADNSHPGHREDFLKAFNELEGSHAELNKAYKYFQQEVATQLSGSDFERYEKTGKLMKHGKSLLSENLLPEDEAQKVLDLVNNTKPEGRSKVVQMIYNDLAVSSAGNYAKAAAVAGFMLMNGLTESGQLSAAPLSSAGRMVERSFNAPEKTYKEKETIPVFEGDPVFLTAAFFHTGTVEYKPGMRDIAKNDIRVFLSTTDLKKSKIIVTGYSSKERPTDLNKKLAEQRTKEGILLVEEVLAEDYAGQNIRIEFVIASNASIYDDMSPELIDEWEKIKKLNPKEFEQLAGSAIDKKQGITIDVFEKTKEVVNAIPVSELPTQIKSVGANNNINIFPLKFETISEFSNVSYLVLDRSNSMRNKIERTSKVVGDVNRGRVLNEAIAIESLQGGDKEAHLNTLLDILKKAKKVKDSQKKQILILTDEFDESGVDYLSKANEVIDLAESKGYEIIARIYERFSGGENSKVLVFDKLNINLFNPVVENLNPALAERARLEYWYNAL